MEGDWRLPTKTELQVLTTGTEPVLSGDMRAFTSVQSGSYWSSTIYAPNTSNAQTVFLINSSVGNSTRAVAFYVWPVRGGQ